MSTRRGRPVVSRTSASQSNKRQISTSAEPNAAAKRKKRRYACSLCPRDFDKRIRLNNHMEKVHQGQSGDIPKAVQKYSCPECHVFLDTELALVKHTKVHEEQRGKLKCPKCSHFFIKQKTLATHMLKYHSLMKCPHCDDSFTQKIGLQAHLNASHSGTLKSVVEYGNNSVDKSHACSFCKEVLRSDTELLLHITRYHHGLRCSKCSLWCQGQECLVNHIKKCVTSPSDQVFVCHFCLKSFAKVTTLVSHIMLCYSKNTVSRDKKEKRSIVTGKMNKLPQQNCSPRNWKCKICRKCFVSRASLSGHMAHCKNNYCCTICDKAYPTQPALEKHVRIFHTGEKPYQCSQCGKLFSHTNLLKVHLEVVHSSPSMRGVKKVKKKMHKCIVCRKAFPQYSFLKMHMRIHTNEKRLKCGICSEKFSNEKAIIEHINIFHVPEADRGAAENMEYIVECVDRWEDQSPLPSQVVHQETTLSKGNLLKQALEGKTNNSPALDPSVVLPVSESKVNSSQHSPLSCHDADTSYYQSWNTLSNKEVPQLIHAVAIPGDQCEHNDKVIHAIVADVSQGNPLSVTDQTIQVACQNEVISSPSQEVFYTNSELFVSHVEPELDSDQVSLVVNEENASSAVITPEDAVNEEDYYVTVNEDSEEDEGNEGIFVKSENQTKNSSGDEGCQHVPDTMDALDDDNSIVPEIEGFSLKDQSFITDEDLHGINGERLTQTCNGHVGQKQMETETQDNDEQDRKRQGFWPSSTLIRKENFSSGCSRSSILFTDCCSEEVLVQHICGICQHGFQTSQDLQRHKSASHSLKCAECKQEYSRMIDLITHYESCTYQLQGR